MKYFRAYLCSAVVHVVMYSIILVEGSIMHVHKIIHYNMYIVVDYNLLHGLIHRIR